MHEFVCCEVDESSSCFNYSTNSITIEPNKLYLNPFYWIIHPSHLTPPVADHTKTSRKAKDCCDFLCKENYTLPDLFHPMTSPMLVTKLPPSTAKPNASVGSSSSSRKQTGLGEKLWKLFAPVIAVDSAVVRCVVSLLFSVRMLPISLFVVADVIDVRAILVMLCSQLMKLLPHRPTTLVTVIWPKYDSIDQISLPSSSCIISYEYLQYQLARSLLLTAMSIAIV